MLERMKMMRLSQGFSQKMLADKVGTSQKSIDNWEKGIVSPSAVSLAKIADILGCSVDYLLDREDDFGQVNVNCDLSEDEKKLLSSFRSIDKVSKEHLLNYAIYLSEK